MAQATFPGANGRIAYQAGSVFSPAIETINPDGSGLTQLGPGQSPSWSADGNKVVFDDGYPGTSGADIWTMNADGTSRTRILDSGYSCDTMGHGGCSGHPFYDPVLSPDSSKVAFESGWDAGGDPDSFGPSEVWEYSLSPGGPFFAPLVGAPSAQPDWSPDGVRILFTREVDCCDPPEISLVGANGSPGNGIAVTGRHPSWSPTGTSFAFDNGRIYRVNYDGTGTAQVTSSGGSSPAWSPDGTKIAYVLSNAHLAVIDADGSNQRDLGVTGTKPSWQPLTGSAGGYARPVSATPAAVRLVPASKVCTTPNSTHGSPLAVPSCNPPAQASNYLTVGTPDVNGKPASSTGTVNMRVRSCPACASPLGTDVLLTAQLTDVRKKSDLSDYTGELQAVLKLRITDRYNGPSLTLPATVTDSSLSFPMTCAATSETAGGACSANTSANAIMPGLVRDYQRAVWELGQVKVYDGGSDGNADTTADNTLFAVQGLFAP